MVIYGGARCLVLQGGVVKKKPVKKFLRGAELLALAEAEERKSRPRDFLPAVDKLRERGFSWRACAEWLDKNAGIAIDHTTLMRLSDNRDAIDPVDGAES
jgi:hypothetical protein